MPTTKLLNESGVSRRDLMRLGAGGLGFSLFGGIGPVPAVLAQASRAAAARQSGKILVVFEWFGGNDGLNTIVPYGDADVLQASADDRHQGTRPAQDRRAVRLAQVDARHEAALRRRQGGDRAGRGLRPAVVLALHVGVVLAHGGAEQRQRVRLDGPHRVGARSRRHAREHDREHLRQPDAGGQGRRTTCRWCSSIRPGSSAACSRRRRRRSTRSARRTRRSATRTSTCWK